MNESIESVRAKLADEMKSMTGEQVHDLVMGPWVELREQSRVLISA